MKTNKKGISLIVLVITIIVMIILATAIILSLNSSGIIGKANEAKQKSDVANAKHVVALARAEWELDKELQNTPFKDYAEQKLQGAGYSLEGNGSISLSETGAVNVIYVDKNDDQAIIPEGFSVSSVASEQTIEDGLVIIDAKGNEFVWIPVEYAKSNTDNNNNGHDDNFDAVFKRSTTYEYYTEPSSYEDDEGKVYQYPNEEAEYEAMYTSVEQNKGFYIARYEAGDGKATAERTGVTPASTVVSKKGAYVYNYVPLGKSMTSIAPFKIGNVNNVAGAVYLSQNMYKGSNSVVSTLCYGVQWDAVMNFVDDEHDVDNDSSTWGNYMDYNNSVDETKRVDYAGTKVFTTGFSEYWKAKNIYDLAGNVEEWTMEAYVTINRVVRGGSYNYNGSDGPASTRSSGLSPDLAFDDYGFRPTLYIK